MDKRLGLGRPAPESTTSEHTLTVPNEVWDVLGLDNPEVVIEYVNRDGEIVLRPGVVVDPADAWFYSPESLEIERQADEDVAAGRVTKFDSGEEFLAYLDKLSGENLGEGR